MPPAAGSNNCPSVLNWVSVERKICTVPLLPYELYGLMDGHSPHGMFAAQSVYAFVRTRITIGTRGKDLTFRFPLILKPDGDSSGERVKIVRTFSKLHAVYGTAIYSASDY